MPFNKKLFDAAREALHFHDIGVTPAFDGGARVIILRDDAAKFSKTGLIEIPESAQRAPRHGTVLALSEQGESTPYLSTVAVGRRVSFNAYDGTIHSIPATLDGEAVTIEVIVVHISAMYLTWKSPDLVVASREGTEREA